ncbi:MAG: DUF4160 domain-containing protein [Bacilli bacterium]|nr:DUF4160 domain-containing protein [Bacilli bacterium]MBO6285493.1 DUF4160 domain-containing protein [Bacilli bacterium]
MPPISVFYGIIIMMYLRDKEHNPPHIHAFYGDDAATFYISNGEIYEGSFPNRAKKMVKEFVLKYQKELSDMWETGKYMKLKGLE